MPAGEYTVRKTSSAGVGEGGSRTKNRRRARQRPRARRLLRRAQGFQISKHAGGIRPCHTELRHRRTGRAPGSRNACGHQRDELLVSAWRETAQSRRDFCPLRVRGNRSKRNRPSQQPPAAIGLPVFSARSVTGPAHADIFHQVLPPVEARRLCGSLLRGGPPGGRAHEQPSDDQCREGKAHRVHRSRQQGVAARQLPEMVRLMHR